MDYKSLKDAIKAVIKKNGAQEITGQIMQDTLLSIVSKLGGNKTFAGVATPTTVPDTTDANIFYIAGENGTYVNFGGAKVENEAAVFVQASGGTWRTIYTGIQTAYGVDKRLQEEHEQFDSALDRIQTDLTQFKQTEFADVKEDVAGHTTEIAKNKSDITKINGEIATLNEASNTAADELVRIEGKVDANLKDAVVVFVPSTNTGAYKDADILGFTNETEANTVNTYMQQYWEKLAAIASGKVAGRVYAEANDANCTGGLCIGGKKFAYTEINVLSYDKGTGLSATNESLKISFDRSETYTEMTFTKKSGSISVAVEEYKNTAGINSTEYDLSSSFKIDRAYWNENGVITYDDEYECISIDMSCIGEIYIKAFVSGGAKVLLKGFNTEILTQFQDRYAGYLIDNRAKQEHDRLLVSCRKEYPLKAIVKSYKKKGIAHQVEAAISDLSLIEIEGNSAFNLDGSRNGNVPGYERFVYERNALVNRYLLKNSCEEKYANLVGFTSTGSAEVIQGYSHLKERLITISEKYIKFGISAKYGTFELSVYDFKEPIIKTLSDLVMPNRSVILHGDSISNNRYVDKIMLAGDMHGGDAQKETLQKKNFADFIAERFRLHLSNFAFDNATITGCKTKAAHDLNCVLADEAIISMSDQKPNYIMLWYGINDVTYGPIMQRELWLKDKYGTGLAYPMQESEIGKEGYATAEQKAEVDKVVGRVGEVDYDNADSYFFAKFVGTENDEELTTWCGALNYAFPLLMSEYPEAKIMIICPDHEKHGKLIREATIKMAEKWGVLYFDLNSLPYWYGSEKTKFENTQHKEMAWLLESGETAAPTVEGFNKSRYSYDGVRPSDLGHKVISFPIGNKLING